MKGNVRWLLLNDLWRGNESVHSREGGARQARDARSAAWDAGTLFCDGEEDRGFLFLSLGLTCITWEGYEWLQESWMIHSSIWRKKRSRVRDVKYIGFLDDARLFLRPSHLSYSGDGVETLQRGESSHKSTSNTANCFSLNEKARRTCMQRSVSWEKKQVQANCSSLHWHHM